METERNIQLWLKRASDRRGDRPTLKLYVLTVPYYAISYSENLNCMAEGENIEQDSNMGHVVIHQINYNSKISKILNSVSFHPLCHLLSCSAKYLVFLCDCSLSSIYITFIFYSYLVFSLIITRSSSHSIICHCIMSHGRYSHGISPESISSHGSTTHRRSSHGSTTHGSTEKGKTPQGSTNSPEIFGR